MVPPHIEGCSGVIRSDLSLFLTYSKSKISSTGYPLRNKAKMYVNDYIDMLYISSNTSVDYGKQSITALCVSRLAHTSLDLIIAGRL